MKEPFKSSEKKNRADEIALPKGEQFSVSLYDVDLAIMEYMRDVVLPELDENGNKIKVPVVYGNPERWKSARKDGVLRDVRGKIQLPLLMYKRNSIERDAASNSMNRYLSYPTYQKYNTKQKYDKFSLMNGVQPNAQNYNITMPDYVSITYEVMVWTNFTEHMNKIVESFQYATDEYWGDKDKFKFRTRIDSFDNQSEVGQGSERIIRTTFNMVTNAYLLPEQFNKKKTNDLSFGPKKVIIGMETDLTGGSGNGITTPKLINEYSDIIDYLALRGSSSGSFLDDDTFKVSNVEVPQIPPYLVDSFDLDKRFSIYINGVKISSQKWSTEVDGSDLLINFNTGSLAVSGSYPSDLVTTATDLGYILENTDEFGITGKFIEL